MSQMHDDLQKNIILIGMPGAGKSTIGVILAKWTCRDFVDTDVLIQLQEHRTLQDIIDHQGYMALRKIEEKLLSTLQLRNHVIATGGSAAYSEAAMDHLKETGPVVFLDVSLDELRRRISNYDNRGIAKRADQTFEELFAERLALYRKHADIILPSNTLTAEEAAMRISEEIG